MLLAMAACEAGIDVSDEELAVASDDALQRAAEAAILSSLEYEPSPLEFEYTGHIEDDTAPWRRGPRRALALAAAKTETGEDDLIDILTRDGRTFTQRAGTAMVHRGRTSVIEGDVSIVDDADDEDVEADDSLSFRELITDGIDNRTRSTATDKQGVMVKIGGTSTTTSPFCSAAMIAPRVFITAAHCVTDSNGDWDYGSADWVMPAARGKSFSGNNSTLDSDDTPFGARQVTRLAKPSAWAGSDGEYDYAVLIIDDIGPDSTGPVEWDPEPALFANDDCTDLEGDNVNLRGYPVETKACTDASVEDAGVCGGYAYTEDDPIDECTSTEIFYFHDSQEAQSGSPVYRYNATTDVRTVIGINRGTSGNRNHGHKIRSGSYGVMCNHVEDPANLSSFFTNPSC
jgi:V8-like Glu-specific endopeptidase